MDQVDTGRNLVDGRKQFSCSRAACVTRWPRSGVIAAVKFLLSHDTSSTWTMEVHESYELGRFAPYVLVGITCFSDKHFLCCGGACYPQSMR